MVRALLKEALHIPDQGLLQVLKAFENAQELQLKYITGNRAWNNFCICLDQRCSRERNLRDRDLKLRDRDFIKNSETWAFCQNFVLNVVITSEINIFYFWLFPTCFGCFLPANATNCNLRSLKICSLRDPNLQIWVSRLHHWFRHKCTLHLLQRILFSPLHVRQWWSLEMWSWSRDFPFFESQSGRFEFLSWSAKIWFSKTFVNQRIFGLQYLQIRNKQIR